MLAAIFFVLLVSFLVYSTFKKPGIALAYLLFFQILNNLMFQQIGLGFAKYGTFIFLIAVLYYKTYNRKVRDSFLRILFQSGMSKIYFLLLLYFSLYAFGVGTEYEYDYLSKFIFPGTIYFILALYFFNNPSLYKDVVVGVIVFSALTLIFIYLFKGFGYITTLERTEISENIGMGPIAQGRMAGMLCLTSVVLFLNTKKKVYKYILLGLLMLAFLWLAMTGTRGALISLVLTFTIYAILNKKALGIASKTLVLFTILIPFVLYTGVLELTVFERLLLLSDQEGIQSTERYRRYFVFLSMPFENFILGLGPGGWGKYVNYELYSFPHNIILESIIEYGLVGLLFISSALISGVKTTIKTIRLASSNIYIVILSLWWVYYTFNTMVSGSYIRGNINFFTLTAILICIRYVIKEKRVKL